MTNTDEFAHLQDNADEGGLSGPLPQGARVATTLPDGTAVSAVRWGHDPKVVLLHGGGQNAHTWDTVVLALGSTSVVGMSVGGLTAIGAAEALFALVTGGDSQFVAEDDVAEFVRRRPGSQFHRIPDAGHSIQSDQPLALADVMRAFLLADTSA